MIFPEFQDSPEYKVYFQPFLTPHDCHSFLMDLKDSRPIDLRLRGLLEYYGKDMISYLREKTKKKCCSAECKDFLRVLGQYFTDYLEDKCPASWWDCNWLFWEEFLFAYYPHQMKLGEEGRVDAFLNQLHSFVRWLDFNKKTSLLTLVNEYTQEARKQIQVCSRLLDHLFLARFPEAGQPDWDYQMDLDKLELELDACQAKMDSVFQIIGRQADLVEMRDIDTRKKYTMQTVQPDLFVPGLLLSGIMGMKKGETHWTWYMTEGIYPSQARPYINFV